MSDVPELTGERVALRPPESGDKAARLALGRDPEIVRMFGGDPRNLAPLVEAEVDAWFHSTTVDGLAWSIDFGGAWIGICRLHSFVASGGRASYAIGIFDPTLLGKGLGTEATRLVLAYAFDELGLRRVEARVLAYNNRAIAAYYKCGFRQERIDYRSALVGDRWEDDLIMVATPTLV